MKRQTTPGWSFPSYPLFVPARTRSTSTWLPYGRKAVPTIILINGGSYFERRSTRAVARAVDHESNDHPASYPRVINEFTKEEM